MTMKLLMLSRDAGWYGGVVNLVASWKKSYTSDIDVVDFKIGDRKGRRIFLQRYLQPFVDAWQLLRIVRREHFDVVHINPSLNVNSLLRDGLFMLVLRCTGQRVLVFFHGWDEALASRILNSYLLRCLMRIAFGKAARILVLADSFREQLVEMGITREKISTITTMFDGAQLEVVRKPREVISRKVLFLSRFVREKGLFELVEAFARISKEYPDARMVMAGDGPVYNELEQAILEAGLSEVVELPGYIRGEDKAVVLNNADIFVLPTYYGEGCPVSMLEAMAAGLAIVSTPVGGIPDILHDGENGVLLASATPDLIYEALHSLMSSSDLLVKIGKTNQDVAWRRYEAKIITAEIEEYYKKVSTL